MQASDVRIYVASSWRNTIQQDVVGMLRTSGFSVFDYKFPEEGTIGFHFDEVDPDWEKWTREQFREQMSHPLVRKGFIQDHYQMLTGDACVMVLPCGRSAHLECGWMLGQSKYGLIYIPEGVEIEPELMYGLADGICLNMEEVVAQLKRKFHVD